MSDGEGTGGGTEEVVPPSPTNPVATKSAIADFKTRLARLNSDGGDDGNGITTAGVAAKKVTRFAPDVSSDDSDTGGCDAVNFRDLRFLVI